MGETDKLSRSHVCNFCLFILPGHHLAVHLAACVRVHIRMCERVHEHARLLVLCTVEQIVYKQKQKIKIKCFTLFISLNHIECVFPPLRQEGIHIFYALKAVKSGAYSAVLIDNNHMSSWDMP